MFNFASFGNRFKNYSVLGGYTATDYESHKTLYAGT
jgi:hypothetical protein